MKTYHEQEECQCTLSLKDILARLPIKMIQKVNVNNEVSGQEYIQLHEVGRTTKLFCKEKIAVRHGSLLLFPLLLSFTLAVRGRIVDIKTVLCTDEQFTCTYVWRNKMTDKSSCYTYKTHFSYYPSDNFVASSVLLERLPIQHAKNYWTQLL